MGFWKKAAISSVAVTAATILGGPIGTLGALGVLGAGAAAGAAAGAGAVSGGVITAAILSNLSKKRAEKERQIGREEGAAEAATRIEKMETIIEGMAASMQEANEHYQFIIALTAVGMAAMEVVGQVSYEATQDIEEYISGISADALPRKVRQRVEELKEYPPTMQEAIYEVRKLPNIKPDKFKNVILLALNENGGKPRSSAGRRFLAEWNEAFA